MEPITNDQTLGEIVDEDKIDPKRFIQVFFFAFGACLVLGAIAVGLWCWLSGTFDGYDKLMERANASFEAGNYEKARDYYQRALDTDENSIDARVGLCRSFEQLQNYDEMGSAAMRGVTLSPATYEFYALKVKAMCYKGDLEGARLFLTQITNSYVLLKVDRNSPGDVKFSVEPGVYGEPISISLSAADGAEIYYTTDGSAPGMNSQKYGEPIKLEDGALNLRCFAMSESGLISQEFNVSYTVRDENAVYTFKDPAVSYYAHRLLQVDTDTELTYAMLDKITVFNTHDYSAGTAIATLDDLKELINVTEVYIDGEKSITDYSVLASMGSLRKISIVNSALTDDKLTQIAAASACTDLCLDGNSLTSLTALKGMTSLNSLSVQKNSLASAAGIDKLTYLYKLYLNGNKFTDLSTIGGLTQLRELYVTDNKLESLNGIGGLSAITKLDVSGNPLPDLSGISVLRTLSTLIAKDCGLRELSSLNGMTSLATIDLSGNSVGSFSPLRQTSVSTLTLTGCGVTDITDICGIRSLRELNLSSNPVSDVKGVAALPTLVTLDISSTNVTSVGGLRGCKTLTTVKAAGCAITDADKLEGTTITLTQ